MTGYTISTQIFGIIKEIETLFSPSIHFFWSLNSSLVKKILRRPPIHDKRDEIFFLVKGDFSFDFFEEII